MNTLSVLIKAAIFLAMLTILILFFRKDGKWAFENGAPAFRYFTVLSNIFSAVTALAMAICQLGGSVPEGVLLLKYMSTVSVTVTMLTVFLFLLPTQGAAKMLGGSNFYMHLIGPGLAIGSYCFLEKRALSLGQALLGVLPVMAYGAVYLWKVIYAPQEKRWEDIYGFNRGGKWPVAFAAMTVATIIVCVVYWRI